MDRDVWWVEVRTRAQLFNQLCSTSCVRPVVLGGLTDASYWYFSQRRGGMFVCGGYRHASVHSRDPFHELPLVLELFRGEPSESLTLD